MTSDKKMHQTPSHTTLDSFQSRYDEWKEMGMDSVIDLTWGALLAFSSLLIIPLIISHFYQLAIAKEALLSVGRMALQLILVGFYLEYLFTLNDWRINVLWLLVMLSVGASSIVSKAHLPQTQLLLPTLFGLAGGMLPILSVLLVGIITPTPWYHTQYMIPLAGMLLGNSLSGNIVALQNLFDCYRNRKNEYEAAIALGASPRYASLLFVRQAMQKSFAPILASMAATGLVTLPGMMTGQILGGASPMVAIKYQLIIMIAIFVTLTLSVAITLELALHRCLDRNGQVKINTLDTK
ncbi:ABC transporter permease [Vibrio vulnificus]|nr:ABC transporter permease [Vibrio vulnificus]EIZ1364220.1 ABC transporter permease [Vibrio vulnificus]EJL6389781.1 ABC transporter permease [Vibrio vulnificus]ELC9715653.1 ABC transporter permease [Vibrio vulnificus]ELS0760347.1 ABC transporter permease [Vibrio vulnificus]